MRFELAKLHQEVKTTMIYVTHDQVEAMTLADKIVVLDGGRVSQQGSPLELYNRPDNKFVAAFIGSPAMNFFGAAVTGRDGGALGLDLPGGREIEIAPRGGRAPGDRAVEVGVRPEHLSLGPPGADGASFDGVVSLAERLGNATLIHVETSAGPLIVEAEGDRNARAGDKVSISLDPSRAHLFGSDGRAI
jgi:multiple sugar transport system ATP-binding protein